MVDLVIVNGQTETDTVKPGAGLSLIIAQGGSVAVNGDNAVEMEGGNLTVAGEVLVTDGTAIRIGDGTTHINIGPTGSVLGSNNNITLWTDLSTSDGVYLTNAGYIGGEYWVGAVGLSQVGDFMSNSGIIGGSIYLNAGNDRYYNKGGTVFGSVLGGQGDDSFFIEAVTPGTQALHIDGESGNDTLDLTGFSAAVWIDLDYGGTNVWTRDNQDLNSGAWRALADVKGIETILGSSRNDYLSGDANNNTFGWTKGLDTISGDGGSDTYDLSAMTSAIWVDLSYSGYDVFTQDAVNITVNGVWRPLADLTSIENIVTTGNTDVVYGDGANNSIFFNGSILDQADVFDGRGGSDTANFSLVNAYAVWVNLGYSGVEAWTNFTADANTAATQHQIVDLANIENVTGSTNADYLAGDSLANRIEGGKGADILWGNAGADTFVFNLAAGNVQGSGFKDTISDMSAGFDKIGLAGLNSLPSIVIDSSPSPTSFGATVLYNTGSGILSYDSDGLGVAASVDIAILTGKPALTSADFILA